ncbi:MAG: hypothetical protein FWC34_02550 [Bacteroidetes bacterium]|nr:hypothetical protein [Bacteroidota bacterium]
MKPKEIIKRAYYSVTCGLFFYIGASLLKDIHLVYVELIILFALAFIWLLTIHNNRRERYIYIGIIFLAFLLIIVGFNLDSSVYKYNKIDLWAGKPPRAHYYKWYYQLFVKTFIIGVCGIIILIAGFLSETKYYNVLKNQPKTVSSIFRILSLIVQVIIWIIPVLLLVFGLFGLIDVIFNG